MRRTPGRPKDDGIDAALLEAVIAMTDDGAVDNITVRQLTARAGVTRDAFYRRFVGIGHFLVSVMLARYPVDPSEDTGTLAGDLLLLQRAQIAMFADPPAQRLMPVLLNAARTEEQTGRALAVAFLEPRRVAFQRMIERAVARGEIPPGADIDAALGVVAGPMIMRVLLPGVGALDDAFAHESARAAHAMLLRPTAAYPDG